MAETLLKIDRAKYVLDRNVSLHEATQSFFRFWRSSTDPANRYILEDCFFFDLHIPVYVKDWPQSPGPPDPGVFEDVFPAILNKLIGPNNVLTLHVESSDPEYFAELAFVRDVLAPRRMDYVLLPSRLDPRYPARIGNLLFEWPVDSIQHIVDEWFMSPQVTIEGYSSHGSCLGKLAERYFDPYGEQNLRKLLEVLEFGFKLGPDNNGLFILSDKLSEDALRERIADANLEATITAAMLDVR